MVKSLVTVLLQMFWFWQWKKVWKLVNIWWSYNANKKVSIFGPPCRASGVMWWKLLRVLY